MFAMKFSAVRKPNERWLMDLILLFIPSTVPFESRILVQGRIPSRWLRSIRANFLNGSSLDRMAELIHLIEQMLPGTPLRVNQNSWKDSFKYQARTSGVIQPLSVESRSFWLLFRFHGILQQ